MWDPILQATAWNSPARAALICRLLGLLLIAVGLRDAGIRWTILAVGGAVLATAAFTLTGHTSVNAHRGALAALLMLHLLVVAGHQVDHRRLALFLSRRGLHQEARR